MSAERALQEELLPTSPEQLLGMFEAHGIAYQLYHHQAVFTSAAAEEVCKHVPGLHGKNFFLRDKRERMALLSLASDTRVDLKKLGPLVGLDRVSFGSPERLWRHLGVRPGSVCPYSVINDKTREVPIYLDSRLFEAKIVNFHPMLNTMSVSIAPADLKRFLESVGHPPHIVDLSSAAPGETA